MDFPCFYFQRRRLAWALFITLLANPAFAKDAPVLECRGLLSPQAHWDLTGYADEVEPAAQLEKLRQEATQYWSAFLKKNKNELLVGKVLAQIPVLLEKVANGLQTIETNQNEVLTEAVAKARQRILIEKKALRSLQRHIEQYGTEFFGEGINVAQHYGVLNGYLTSLSVLDELYVLFQMPDPVGIRLNAEDVPVIRTILLRPSLRERDPVAWDTLKTLSTEEIDAVAGDALVEVKNYSDPVSLRSAYWTKNLAKAQRLVAISHAVSALTGRKLEVHFNYINGIDNEAARTLSKFGVSVHGMPLPRKSNW